MPAANPSNQRQCPICWTWFTANPANSRRYCCGACRIEDSRRRRQRAQNQPPADDRKPP